nr:hypothetical protein [Tanacetum cinerariifolium]
MFNEYFNEPTIAVSPVLVAATPRAVDMANSRVFTSIDQDAPSIILLKVIQEMVKCVSTASVNTVFGVSTASPQVSTANLSDATMYAFLANQPNGSQLVHEDLEQIHEDDLEEIDLKWQLALLNMRAKRVPRNQENRTRNQETTRSTVNMEDTSSKAIVAIDEAGFDWSYMDDDECNTPKSGLQRNIKYQRALLHRSIAQDMRMTTRRVIF